HLLKTVMAVYRIEVSYRGSDYLGWQIQDEKQGKTIQGELYQAFFSICRSRDIKIIGASRTDAGVHSLGQVFRADSPFFIAEDSLKHALNSQLPRDIRIIKVESCADDFHPIRDAKRKEYLYFFSCDSSNPFNSDLLTSLPYAIDKEKIRQGASLFEGRHDFCNFYCKGSDIKSTVRTIYSCNLYEHQNNTDLLFPPHYYSLKICGDGFLKQMIRLIMGTLWNLGKGKISLLQIENSLQEPLEQKLAPVAPAKGLYLSKIEYI
ncbi:MAG: tRNA pseudouridine(38-40) synthase TruA, partial [Halobacteriovoraceae bacterium]|nr:tRNA pseudouridine(38-40) synthase TruA [Halobacteriovoraceae bacterium]